MSEKYTGHNLNPESVGEISSRNKNRAEIKKMVWLYLNVWDSIWQR